MSFEEKMKQDLKKDLEIPEIVEQKIQDAYKEIGQGKLRMKKPDNRNQKRKKVWTTAAAAVAVVAAAVRAAAADDRAEKGACLSARPFFIAQRLRKKEKQLAFSSRLCYNTNRLLLMWHRW